MREKGKVAWYVSFMHAQTTVLALIIQTDGRLALIRKHNKLLMWLVRRIRVAWHLKRWMVSVSMAPLSP